ncbi:MAG: hypothetical protein AAB316_05305, partial [Bacteroidota bacterium]
PAKAKQQEMPTIIHPMSETELRETKILREKSWFKEKYLNSLRTVTRTRMKRLRNEQPDLPFNKLLALLLDEFPAEAPPQLMAVMTNFIVEEWEKSERRDIAFA